MAHKLVLESFDVVVLLGMQREKQLPHTAIDGPD